MEKTHAFTYTHFDTLNDLDEVNRALVEAARRACRRAYAPYSHFRVGAAARLHSGRIVTGNNQESKVFPAGMCAERNLLFHHAGLADNDPIESLAIVSDPAERECTPCGICRQVLVDVQQRQGTPIRILMVGADSVTLVDDATFLLPFAFEF